MPLLKIQLYPQDVGAVHTTSGTTGNPRLVSPAVCLQPETCRRVRVLRANLSVANPYSHTQQKNGGDGDEDRSMIPEGQFFNPVYAEVRPFPLRGVGWAVMPGSQAMRDGTSSMWRGPKGLGTIRKAAPSMGIFLGGRP